MSYVRSSGDRVHRSLSNISYSTQMRPSMVSARSGGLVGYSRPAPVVVKMEGGGRAPIVSEGGGRNINVTIAPQYMTGDRRSMRQAAVEIKRELEALGVRWGK